MGLDGPFGLVMKEKPTHKVVFCIPTHQSPHDELVNSIEAAVPLLDMEGWDHGIVFEINCPYISAARATMLRKALDVKADTIVFLDHDLGFDPENLVTLLRTKGDVVCGTYRFKHPEEEYMGLLLDGPDNRPIVREDGCVAAELIPAGFMKITASAIDKMMRAYPNLCYGPVYSPWFDLFNHGADEWRWWGEDYAFSRRWRAIGGELWIIPNLNIDHYKGDHAFKGNFHEFLLRQPGGSKHVKTHFDAEVRIDGVADRMRPKSTKKIRNERKGRMGRTGNSGHRTRAQA